MYFFLSIYKNNKCIIIIVTIKVIIINYSFKKNLNKKGKTFYKSISMQTNFLSQNKEKLSKLTSETNNDIGYFASITSANLNDAGGNIL
jgi:hypothetical protein